MDKITIEAKMYYSDDSYEYDENIVNTKWEDVKLYIDYGNLSSDFDDLKIDYGQNEKLFEIIKSEAPSLLSDLEERLNDAIDDSAKDEIITDFFSEEFIPFKFYDREITKKIDFLKDNEIASNWSDYDCVSVSGYSQGDARDVLINVKEAEEVWGVTPDLDALKKDISNFMYDSPMNLRLDINGVEYGLDKDGCYDGYDYSETNEECFELIKKEFPSLDDDIINDALEEIIPAELEHGYSSESTSIYFIEKEKSNHLNKIVSDFETNSVNNKGESEDVVSQDADSKNKKNK